MSTNKKIDKVDTDRIVANSSSSRAKDIDALTDAAVSVSNVINYDGKKLTVSDGHNKAPEDDGLAASETGNAKVGTLDAAVAIAATSVATAANEPELTASFPQKLMEILSIEEYHDIVRWLPHGKGFIIADKKRFASEVLPKHFKQAKFTSFTRKLNRWNFIRVTRGPEVGSYHHPSFQKDQTKLVHQMTCIGSKQAQSLKPLDPIALGIVPMGDEAEKVEMALSESGVQQWQPQDHERYRLFYQQHHWNYMMQMMQASAQAQGSATATTDAASKNEETADSAESVVETSANDEPGKALQEKPPVQEEV